MTTFKIKPFQYRYSGAPSPVEIPEAALTSGKFNLLWGKSGNGKTTLLNILSLILETGILASQSIELSGLGRLDLPEIIYYSKLTHSLRKKLRQSVFGVVLQSSFLLESFSCLKNLELCCKIKKANLEGIEALRDTLLKGDELNDKLHYYPRQLSMGQRQRVAVLRAMVGNPIVLFADEPTASLDKDNQDRVLKQIMTWIKEDPDRMVVFVSHKIEIRQVADNVVDFNCGRF